MKTSNETIALMPEIVRRWKQYPMYSDLGLPWKLAIPSHWQRKCLKYLAVVRPSNVDKKSVEGQVSIRLCNYVDVYKNDYITADLDFMQASASNGQIAAFSLKPGDVIITKDSESWDDIAVPAYVRAALPGVVCGYHLALVRSKPKTFDGEYLFRCFSAEGICDQFRIAANGITRFGLGSEAINDSLFPVPPLEEQRTIATFLHRETAKIDALIAKKERLIELLQEKRTALISHAVTKGLDPSVPMKDSGVEWIGKVPAHWQMKKFAWISVVVRGASPRPAGNPRFFNGNHIPWITVAEITKDKEKYLTQTEKMLTFAGMEASRVLKAGTLVLTNSGATLGVPKILGVTGCANDGVVAFLHLSKELNIDFGYHYLFSLTSMFRQRIKQGSGQPNLNTDIVKATPIMLPPSDEQCRIVGYVEKLVDEQDKLNAKVRIAIEKLHEYRSALISAAVTGKIDVREEGQT